MVSIPGFVESNCVGIDGAQIPIYLLPEIPFWFLPSTSAHEVLKATGSLSPKDDLIKGWRTLSGKSTLASTLDIEHLLRSLDVGPVHPYNGRGVRSLGQLSEVWFHITDHCNLMCRHCLFGDNLSKSRALEIRKVQAIVAEAYSLGCRLFCFSGGEPFVYPGFETLLEWILRFDDVEVAVLTNGLLIPKYMGTLKRLDLERMHFQVSLDGLKETNDRIRGQGTFEKTTDAIRLLVASRMSCSVATALNPLNSSTFPDLLKLLKILGVNNLHFLWHIQRGFGEGMEIPAMDGLIPRFREVAKDARELGIAIDNMEAIRAQLFSPIDTRFDLSNAAWESLTIAPDGAIYPTPATVDVEGLNAGHSDQGIENVWKESEVLKRVRALSLLDSPQMAADPWRFILGGGDLDHSIVLTPEEDSFNISLRPDPYMPLYREIARIIVEEEAQALPHPPHPGVILRMGDVSTDCPSGNDVNFTHSNCLLSIGVGDSHGLIREFYAKRAIIPDETILNPVAFDEEETSFIPAEAKVRMYGCGSPVMDAGIQTGGVMVDLGCGTGVECFLAAKTVGEKGRVIGLDMTDPMLDMAKQASESVCDHLGYRNTAFMKGYMEAIPLADATADVVISNCVVNLSKHKRKVFREILRILKPGGRLVIADVITETEPHPSIRADHQLCGECIGGAMVQDYLFALMKDVGFVDSRILKRFPYRTVQGHQFYSVTFSGFRPSASQASGDDKLEVVYAGPFQAVVTEDGQLLSKGERKATGCGPGLDHDQLAGAGLFILEPESGQITNTDATSSCACFTAPTAPDATSEEKEVPATGCLICGRPLTYLRQPEDRACAKCGVVFKANAICEVGHFVCDQCHLTDPVAIIKKVCLSNDQTDMIALLKEIRKHKPFPLHGPEHHGLVPGIILSTYRNLGAGMDDECILAGIDRGNLVPGGACAFMGTCGAAVGVGIAFSLILESTPLRPKPRQIVQQLVSGTIQKMSDLKAARCCQRECYIALKEAARASTTILPLTLKAEAALVCEQYKLNKECVRKACSLYREEIDLIAMPATSLTIDIKH